MRTQRGAVEEEDPGWLRAGVAASPTSRAWRGALASMYAEAGRTDEAGGRSTGSARKAWRRPRAT